MEKHGETTVMKVRPFLDSSLKIIPTFYIGELLLHRGINHQKKNIS